MPRYTYSGWLIFVKKTPPIVFFKLTDSEKFNLYREYEEYTKNYPPVPNKSVSNGEKIQ